MKTHLIHIYGKLAVSDRAAAVARAFETGCFSISVIATGFVAFK